MLILMTMMEGKRMIKTNKRKETLKKNKKKNIKQEQLYQVL